MQRLVSYGSMGDFPNLEEVVDSLLETTWGAETPEDEYGRQVLNVAQRITIDEMRTQASNSGNSGEVRAVLASRLNALAGELEGRRNKTAHEEATASDIRQWQRRAGGSETAPALQMPPGDPI